MPTRLIGWTLAFTLLCSVTIAELLGWPFLAKPISGLMSRRLERQVSFVPGSKVGQQAADQPSVNESAQAGAFSIRFLGLLRLDADTFWVAAPVWSTAPFTVAARGLKFELRYPDLWRYLRGGQLAIERLQAESLDAHIERLTDGRASWLPDSKPVMARAEPVLPWFNNTPEFQGNLTYRDDLYSSDVDARWSLAASGIDKRALLQLDAKGHYRKLPVNLALKSMANLPAGARDGPIDRIEVSLKANLGRATLVFNGGTRASSRLESLDGRYVLEGPSLAAVGDPLGLTLPSTPAFRMAGILVRAGDTWQTVLDDARIGSSQLNGAFSYVAGQTHPVLAGRLTGSRLLLADLGPAIGMTDELKIARQADKQRGVKAKLQGKIQGKIEGGKPSKVARRVLPDRKFDLQGLRAMDANILIDIREVDLNTALLEPLRPLRAHLQLIEGVLTLRDIDARTADGNLRGDMELDGRGALARLKANLRWDAVRLERWIVQKRAAGLPPYVSGRLTGRAALQGQGRSTAEILSTLSGRSHMELLNGSVSHLAVEVGGLDIAQAVGLLFKGDTSLTIQCAVADMNVQGGNFEPRLMVLDTIDSVVSVDGSLSLANESLDLRAVVLPKDFSPVTLRSPLHVRGSFADPDVSVEKQALSLKVASSLLLGLLNPLAAFLPLIDAGDAAQAQQTSVGCRNLMQRRPTSKLQVAQ
jgi:AsmA family protein